MDELDRIKKLAGVSEFKGWQPVATENISHTGTEKQRLEKEMNIRPGDLDWFKLWFSRPYWLGFPPKFRGRKA
jgi:hypothetical protein